MATRIQLRRDTAADWVSNNPTLALGEPGHETDTNKLKIGNGVDDWNSLDYAIIEQFDSEFASLINTPTTISGYGITDAITTAGATLVGPLDAPTVDNHKLKFLYANQSAFPDASTYHGAIAHSHADGKMFFAHGGAWLPLKNETVYNDVVVVNTPGSLYQYNFNNYNANIFYHFNLSSNWTANLINLPLDNDRQYNFRFYIEQSVTPYIPITVQINSLTQSIEWQAGSAPSGTPNATDIIEFNILRYNNNWTVQAEFKKPAEGFTTLNEYGITDAYTQTQVDNLINGLNISNIGGTSIASPSANQILTYSGGVWTNVGTFTGNVSTSSITTPLGGDLTVTPSTIFSNNLTTEGNLTVEGNLTIQGTTTTIESTTLSIQDKNITLATTAQNSGGADGAGITVNGALAEIKYVDATTSWNFNKDVRLSTNESLFSNDIRPLIASNGSLGGPDERFGSLYVDNINMGTLKFKDAHFTQIPKLLSSVPVSDSAFQALADGAVFGSTAANFGSLMASTNPDTSYAYADVDQSGSILPADYQSLADYGEYIRTSGASGSNTAQAAWEAIEAKIEEQPSLYAHEYIEIDSYKKIPVLESGAGIGLGSTDVYIGDETNVTKIFSDVELRHGATLKNSSLGFNQEVLQNSTNVSGVHNYDVSNGLVFYTSGSASNWTANFVNLPNTNNRVISISMLVAQAATPYLPLSVQIDGVSTSINWNGGTPPTGTANGYDFINYTLVKQSGTYQVFGDGSSYS